MLVRVILRGRGGKLDPWAWRGPCSWEMTNAVYLITFSGQDRPGLVDALSDVIARHGGNWERSRMMHLSGRFIGLLEVHVDAARAEDLKLGLQGLEGLEMTIAHGQSDPPPAQAFDLEVLGADHPGIVSEIFSVVARAGLNVESLRTRTEAAPDSGTPMFRAQALLGSSGPVDLTALEQALGAIATDIQVTVSLAPHGE